MPALLLVGLTVGAYIPAMNGGFIWDDDDYVQDNLTLRSPAGLGQIWFQPGATRQYYPLVHTTYWLEYRLWGLDPTGYHVVNVILHALSAVLIWRLLNPPKSARCLGCCRPVCPAPSSRRVRGVDYRAQKRVVRRILSECSMGLSAL